MTERRLTISVIITVMLCCLIAGVVVTVLPGPGESLSWTYLLLGLLFVIALGPMVKELCKDGFDFFNVRNLFVLYYLLQLGIYPLYVLLTGETIIPWLRLDTYQNRLLFTVAIALSVLGLLAFYFGYSLKGGAQVAHGFPTLPAWDIGRVPVLVLMNLVLGWSSLLVLMRTQGGVQSFRWNIEGWRAGGLTGFGFLIYPINGLLPTTFLIILLAYAGKQRSAFQRFVVLLLFVLTNSPGLSLGFRNSLLYSLISIAVIWHYVYRPISLKQLVLLALLVTCLFTIWGLNRSGVDLIELRDIIRSGEWYTMLRPVILRSPGTEIVVKVIQKLSDTGDFQYGWRSILEALTTLIPRRIFPGKPDPLGPIFGETFMLDYLYWRSGTYPTTTSGTPPTIVGFLYWQFGAAGVVFGMFLAGIAAKAAYTYMRANLADRSRLLVYCVLSTLFVGSVESPQDALNRFVINLFFTTILLFGLTVRSASSTKCAVTVERPQL